MPEPPAPRAMIEAIEAACSWVLGIVGSATASASGIVSVSCQKPTWSGLTPESRRRCTRAATA